MLRFKYFETFLKLLVLIDLSNTRFDWMIQEKNNVIGIIKLVSDYRQ